MTATEKLINKEFKIKSEEALLKLIESKPAEFFQQQFFIEKDKYIAQITKLIREINDYAFHYREAQSAAKSGSIIRGFASSQLGEIQTVYVERRKTILNHIRFFIKSKNP